MPPFKKPKGKNLRFFKISTKSYMACPLLHSENLLTLEQIHVGSQEESQGGTALFRLGKVPLVSQPSLSQPHKNGTTSQHVSEI